MARAKNSDDFNEIIAAQLDILSSGAVTEAEYKRAEAITKLIGNQLKKDKLRLSYFGMIKKTPPVIATFEGKEAKNTPPKAARKSL